MRRYLTILFWLATCSQALAQETLRAAMYLSGASSEEEVPEAYVELVENSPRIRVNGKHLRPGLLSDYQIASLADYRALHGDVLSFEELALVDGFGAEAVDALRPFLSLESSRLPGNRDTVKVKALALLRGTLTTGLGTKGRVSGENWRAGGAWRSGGGSFYGEYTGRWGRVLVGDYNLRYGQGLACWTGFSMSSLSTVEAFVLKPSGITPAWSYTPADNRGAAYEYSSRHLRAAVFASLQGNFGAHADWFWRRGQVGGTVLVNTTGQASGAIIPGSDRVSVSLDGRYNVRGADLAWEAAYKQKSFAAKAAFRIPLGPFRVAVQGRGIPSKFSGKKYGEYGLSAGMAYKSPKWQTLAGKTGFGSSVPRYQASLTLDASLLPVPEVDPRRFQLRVYGTLLWQLHPAWALELRVTERYRNYEAPRTSLRTDLRLGIGPSWLSTLRAEAVHCLKIGLLGYWESGYKGKALAGYLRITGFSVPQWDDRIYCYERDAPGTFSVPAYYGEGAAFSLVGSWKHRFGRWVTLRLNARGAYMIRRDREPVPTLNLQLQAEL